MHREPVRTTRSTALCPVRGRPIPSQRGRVEPVPAGNSANGIIVAQLRVKRDEKSAVAQGFRVDSARASALLLATVDKFTRVFLNKQMVRTRGKCSCHFSFTYSRRSAIVVCLYSKSGGGRSAANRFSAFVMVGGSRTP